jgi:hypothetical protein
MNSEDDRKTVVGEKSLNITDKVPFERIISQIISSSPYVKLKDGAYALKATIRATEGFSKLEMYAESNGRKLAYDVLGKVADWQVIELKHIAVKNGKVEIGFTANGNALASCQVDDVSLIME